MNIVLQTTNNITTIFTLSILPYPSTPHAVAFSVSLFSLILPYTLYFLYPFLLFSSFCLPSISHSLLSLFSFSNYFSTDPRYQPRTEAILTYAMCGLSGFPAVGITMGTLVSMSPARKKDVLNLVISAFVAGNLASYATGAVAGKMLSRFFRSFDFHRVV